MMSMAKALTDSSLWMRICCPHVALDGTASCWLDPLENSTWGPVGTLCSRYVLFQQHTTTQLIQTPTVLSQSLHPVYFYLSNTTRSILNDVAMTGRRKCCLITSHTWKHPRWQRPLISCWENKLTVVRAQLFLCSSSVLERHGRGTVSQQT